MRKNKKLKWSQAYFLGDVRVIWCNSLDDNHFQTYVMNFVEIVIDHYLLITSHISHAFTSRTHYTSYSLLNLVHDIVCEFVLAIRDYISLDFNAKCVFMVEFLRANWLKTCFWKFWVKSKCFWKTLHLIFLHFIHKTLCFKEFLH